MLDPSYVRDNIEAVQQGLGHRGLDAKAELQQLATFETQRRRLIPAIEGLKREQNTSGDQVARAKRNGEEVQHLYEASKQRNQKIKQMEVELEAAERQRTLILETLPNLPHASVPVGKSAADNVGGADVGRAEAARLRAEGALGPRPAARHHRLRAGDEDLGLALRDPDGRRRATRARADQLHADAAHERARLHRSAAAVPGVVEHAVRHRPAAEVRAGSVQDRRASGICT